MFWRFKEYFGWFRDFWCLTVYNYKCECNKLILDKWAGGVPVPPKIFEAPAANRWIQFPILIKTLRPCLARQIFHILDNKLNRVENHRKILPAISRIC